MFVEEALRILLTAPGPLHDLVGDRIFSLILPQTVTYPAIAFRLIGDEATPRLSAPGESQLSQVRFRFFSTSKTPSATYAEARRVDGALKQVLIGFRGTIVNPDASPITTDDALDILGIFHHNTITLYDDHTQTAQVVSEFDVWAATPKIIRSEAVFIPVSPTSNLPAFPVGSILLLTVNVNPETLLGYGTWEQL